MNYLVMNKNKVLMKFHYETYGNNYRPVKDSGDLPFIYKNKSLYNFLDSRTIAKKRTSIRKSLSKSNLKTNKDILDVTYGLSLTDTLWVKPSDSILSWEDINLYDNIFDEVIGQICIINDNTPFNLSSTSPELATDGMLPKCWIRESSDIYMLKGGTSGTKSMGREPVSEYLSYQLGRALGLNCLSYELIMFKNRLVSKCPIMTNKDVGIISIGVPYSINNYFDLISICTQLDCIQDLYDMLAFDVLTGNNDRHLGNIQLMFNNDTFNIIGLSPIFDNGQAFCNRIPKVTLDAMINLYNRRCPALYDSFDDYLDIIISDSFKARLKDINGFKFKGSQFISSSELEVYNDFITYRINNILDKNIFYKNTNLFM